MKLLKSAFVLLFVVAAASFAAEWTGANSEPAATKTIDGKKFYVISSANELAWFAVQVNSGKADINGFLKNDINLGPDEENYSSYPWTPIGKDSTKLFGGAFDGNGKKIGGLKISSGKFNGLFGVTDENAQIKNLTIGVNSAILDSSALGKVYAGMFVAVNNGTIMNVTNQGNIKIQTYIKKEAYGFYTYNYVAGITGQNNGIVQNAVNDGLVFNYQYAENTLYERGATANPHGYVGGIAGYNTGSIDKSINLDSLYNRAVYKVSYTYSDIKSYAVVYAGGVTGYNTGYVQNCINYGNEYADGNDIYAGGVVGATNLNTINSFSVRGLVASPNFATNCYYNLTLASQIPALEGVVAISTEDMQVDKFAWILNSTNGNAENSGVWSRYDGYPVYANDTLLAIRKIIFDDGENTSISYTNYKGLVSEYPEVPQAPEGKAFAGWVDADGNVCDGATVFTADQTLTASFLDWEDVLYTVQFLDENGKLLDKTTVHSGETPVYSGSNPVKQETKAYTYSFAKWSPDLSAVTWHTDFIALFDSTLKQYKITYNDFDGKELFASDFDYGTKPSYSTIPTRATTDQYIYTFTGWNPAVELVSGIATYTAQYDSTLREYAITFKNGDVTLSAADFAYGVKPNYSGETPTKAATKQYSYTFKGWKPEITTVSKATTYEAVFDSSLNKFTITFTDGMKILQTSDENYGSMPNYTESEPVKVSSSKYDYKFKTWTPTLAKITDDATYTAVFDSTIRNYEITFVNEKTTLQSEKAEYGSMPSYSGDEPTKKASEGYTYSFAGWEPTVTSVSEDVIYKAVFDSTAKKFKVVFMNGKDTLQSSSVEYNVLPKYTGKEPSKEKSKKYTYTFAGWDKDVIAVTKDAVYKAVFDSTETLGITFASVSKGSFAVKSIGNKQISIQSTKAGQKFHVMDMQGRIIAIGEMSLSNVVVPVYSAGNYIVQVENTVRMVNVR